MSLKPFPINTFTDSAAKASYAQAHAARQAATTLEAMRDLKLDADQQREVALTRGPLLTAACTYLALAQTKTVVGDADPEEFFHFAANAFRDLGQLQRAAQCYFNSALLGHQKYQRGVLNNAAFATRSAGRAKAIFADLGEDESSDRAHVLQQVLKRAEFCERKKYLLALIFFLWEVISGYGTSPVRWAISLGSSVLASAAIHLVLLHAQSVVVNPPIARDGLAYWTSALYFAVGNLMQFGTLGSLTPQTALAQLVFVLHAVVAIELLGTGASFLSRR